MIEYEDGSISFEETDLKYFSEDSGDVNPLHMDRKYAETTVYGERVVFGMLGIEVLLKKYQIEKNYYDIKFYAPLFLGRKYYHRKEEKKGKVCLYIEENGNKLLSIKCNNKESQTAELQNTTTNQLPMFKIARNITDEEIEKLSYEEGEYIYKSFPQKNNICTQIKTNIVLKFCSYVVGMVFPGERAVFMGATISVCEHEIFSQCMQYSLQKTNYDNKFGIVEYTLFLKCQNKTLAICTIQAYVRANFKLDMQEGEKISCEFQGKTVLIIGGTKGIGAELAKKYALGGARVLLTYCHDEDKAEEVKKKIQKYNQNVKLYRGDMRDYADCKRIQMDLQKENERIDRLFLCSALPTKNMQFYPEGYRDFEKYLGQGVQIFYLPFYMLYPLVCEGGKVVVLSSSAVAQKKEASKMLDYICVKSIIESITECTAYTDKIKRDYYIIRPPKMLTEMNNTPIGRIGAAEPKKIAQEIIKKIEEDKTEKGCKILDF